jgi:hypothetical protein
MKVMKPQTETKDAGSTGEMPTYLDGARNGTEEMETRGDVWIEDARFSMLKVSRRRKSVAVWGEAGEGEWCMTDRLRWKSREAVFMEQKGPPGDDRQERA